MLFVAKFGGTSISCAEQFAKVKNIVLSDPSRRVVVVSALGKRQPTDNKLTDLFYSIFENRSQSSYYNELWQEVIARFVAVKLELQLEFDVEGELKKIQDGLAARKLTLDYLVSRGEYLTAKLMSEYLGYDFYDAKDLIIFGEDGEVDSDLTYSRIASLIPRNRKVIIPGFYGADSFGDVKLFSRGGSDITGALIAAGLKADKYENFTDVPGVLMADPRIVLNPAPIPEITYDEMSAIAYMGAEVLHKKSVHPVKFAGIPIHIKNTNDPLAPGTLITCSPTKIKNLIGIFGKKDYTVLTIKTRQPQADEFRDFFASYNIKVEYAQADDICIEVVISTVDIKYRFEHIINKLKLSFEIESISSGDKMAIITIFTRENMFEDMPILGSYFAVLEQNDEMLMILTADDFYEDVIRGLYRELV